MDPFEVWTNEKILEHIDKSLDEWQRKSLDNAMWGLEGNLLYF